MKIQFGFDDQAYIVQSSAPPTRFGKGKPKARPLSMAQVAYGQGKTTGQVSADLEKRYGIVEAFYELEKDKMIKVLSTAYKTAADLIDKGVTITPQMVMPTKELTRLEKKFVANLKGRVYDGKLRGVPTRRAQLGVSHLFKNPYAKRPPRPSFVDTGLYAKSFKAWVE